MASLFPNQIAKYNVTRCKLQMLRLADPGFRLPGVLMSDLGLVRYAGYSALPEATALRERLAAEQARAFAAWEFISLRCKAAMAHWSWAIVISTRTTPDFFADERVDQLILDEFAAATGRTAERGSRTLDRVPIPLAPTAACSSMHRRATCASSMITSGSGASTGFAIGEEVVAELLSGSVARWRFVIASIW